MTIYFDLALLMGLWGVAAITRRYMICAGMVFLLMVIDIWLHSMTNALMLCAGIFLLCWMIIKDTLKNKADSVVLKYNPLYAENKLNPKIRIAILIIFIVAFLIRIVAFFALNR